MITKIFFCKLFEQTSINRWMKSTHARICVVATTDETDLQIAIDKISGNAMGEGATIRF